MSRSFTIDVVRTVCCFLIVAHHCVFQDIVIQDSSVEQRIVTGILKSCWTLPSLFLLSGYLMMSGFDACQYWPKFKRRIKRLIIPFVVYNALYIICFSSAADWISFDTVLKVGGFNKMCPDFAFWYVRVLVVYFLLLPLVYLMTRTTTRQILLLIVLVACAVVSSCSGYDVLLSMVIPPYSLLLMTIGAILSARNIDICVFAKQNIKIFAPLFFIGVIIFVFRLNHTIAAVCMAFFWFAIADYLKGLFGVKNLSLFIEMAFFAFGVHLAFRSILLSLLPPELPAFFGCRFFYTALEFILVVVMILLSFLFMRKFCRPAYRVLGGFL